MRFKRNHNYEIVDQTKNKKKHISKEPMMALLLSIDKHFWLLLYTFTCTFTCRYRMTIKIKYYLIVS